MRKVQEGRVQVSQLQTGTFQWAHARLSLRGRREMATRVMSWGRRGGGWGSGATEQSTQWKAYWRWGPMVHFLQSYSTSEKPHSWFKFRYSLPITEWFFLVREGGNSYYLRYKRRLSFQSWLSHERYKMFTKGRNHWSKSGFCLYEISKKQIYRDRK